MLQIECYNCHKMGHLKRNCKSKSARNNREKRCFYCHKSNHLESKCFLKKKHEKKFSGKKFKSESTSRRIVHHKFKRILQIGGNERRGEVSSIDLENVLFLNGKVNFLVDTGASVNLIKSNVLKTEMIINKMKIVYLIGINSQMTKTLGEIKLHINGIETWFQVVSPDFPIRQQGILGISFLKQHKTILNFINNYIRINNVDIPFSESKGYFLRIPYGPIPGPSRTQT